MTEGLFGLFKGWSLRRSPLAPSVPLEGSDTVEGLLSLERMAANSFIDGPSVLSRGRSQRISVGAGASGTEHRRKRYRRFRGPYVEQLTLEDLNKQPRSWKAFVGMEENDGDGRRGMERKHGYSVPANLDLLSERMEENLVYYCPNYIRAAVVILLLTLYLRPVAVLGAISLALSTYLSISAAMRRQQMLARASASTASQRGQYVGSFGDNLDGLQPQRWSSVCLSIVSWFLVVYTRCIPIISLGVFFAVVFVGMHAASRESPSETRYRGRQPINYQMTQVLGYRTAPKDSDPRFLFKEIAITMRRYVLSTIMVWRRRLQYHVGALRDRLRWGFRRPPQTRTFGEWH